MGKTCALTHHCTAVVSETLTQAITLDKLQQITCRQAPRHQALIHDSHWVPCCIPSQISCPHQFDAMNMFPMSRSDVDDLRKDECLQLMEQLGEAQLRRGVLVMELMAMIKDLLFSDEDGQEQPLLGLAKMNRSPLADKARKLNIPTAESHTKGHSIRLKRENHMQQSTPVGSDYLEFGKHGAKTYQEVLKLDPEHCWWIDKVEDQQSDFKLKRFSSWLTMQRVPEEPNLENNMTQERLTRRIKQLEAENLFDNSTGEEKSGAEGASSGIDGTSPVVDEAFARVWRGEIGKEFCGMADARRKNTMSTARSDEMAWAEEQARHSPKVPHWSVRTISARNRDESGGDFSHVCFVLSDTFWYRITTNQAFQKRHRRLWNTSCRRPNAIGTRF